MGEYILLSNLIYNLNDTTKFAISCIESFLTKTMRGYQTVHYFVHPMAVLHLCWRSRKGTESPHMDSGMLEAVEVQIRAWDFESLLHRKRLVCLAGCDFEWQ